MTEQKLEIIQQNQKQHYKEGVYKILGIKEIEQPSRVSFFIPVQYLHGWRDTQNVRINQFREQNTKYATILTNIDQVQKLKWGTQNLQYTVKWCPIWEARIIINAGGEVDKNNLKIGKWVELSDNYCNISQVTHEGIYNNGLRIGKWVTYFKENIICEGEYNSKGVEIGNWVHVHDRFSNNYQIIYQGEYKNGKKFGQWNIIDISTQNKFVIGGGLYGTEGEKVGKWTELHNNFANFNSSNKYGCQILWKGNYRNGKKIGKWDILYSKELKFVDKYECIGGGLYDETELKKGIWVELSENFNNCSQVRSFGEYDNGKKIGRWNIQIRDEKKDNFITIGGGQYDDEGKQKGKWIELYQNFRRCQKNNNFLATPNSDLWGIIRKELNKDSGDCILGIFFIKIFNIGNFQLVNLLSSVGAYNFGQKNGKWMESDLQLNFTAVYWYLHQFNFNQLRNKTNYHTVHYQNGKLLSLKKVN
ncbi:unnamed protein product (macronuclear) [Paramecium tetraurelia]|uniref:Uncharacterized protein n=1 Tax=Paramecium tetraurelia TaxID=5888 RepID=A0CZG1_PARTE|nr:uncharacterized protein GSPATT00011751001 [Paramecium tetraurelia]CAK76178.1 unnamed protein product [Paramecium tetraurelia]|eukprot:XP_001443575.1 hypothetical protein (macronuclear) [Paramecium tetraurelia strain d4-2]